MSFAALGLFGVVTFGAAALTVLVTTLTALGAATLTALTVTFLALLLRGVAGLVAVATVIE